MMTIRDVIVLCAVSILLTAFFIFVFDKVKHPKYSNPYFVVKEMVQCKGTICNAVLTMDDIAILVPYDSTKVHVGDTLYITK